METVLQDLRFAVRLLVQKPGVSFIVVLYLIHLKPHLVGTSSSVTQYCTDWRKKPSTTSPAPIAPNSRSGR